VNELLSLLQYASPVALAAIGETVAQKSGVINIGLEGAMLCAAYASVSVTYSTGNPWLGLGAGVLVGVAVALLFALFSVVLLNDQVVVGTAINLLALGLTGALFRASFGQTGQLISVQRLPAWHGVDPLLALLLLSIPGLGLLLGKTRWGLVLRATGEFPKAADAAGFSVMKLRIGALAIGGLYAGCAGAYLSLVIAGTFAENMTAGRGFVAIALVAFGRWRPHFVVAAALLVGFVESLQFRFQTYGWHAPYQLFIALPYVVALLVLVIVGKGTRAPETLGQPYKRSR
jgi:simple sugar transport system permease protein